MMVYIDDDNGRRPRNRAGVIVDAIGYNATAYDERGHGVTDRIWHDMDVRADFNGPDVEPARDWANRTIAADDRVAYVTIAETYRPMAGVPWQRGVRVETVRRHIEP